MRFIPYTAPDTAMVVMLPVPILYPIRKIPGVMDAINTLNFFNKTISLGN